LALLDQGLRFAPPRPALFDGQMALRAGRRRRPLTPPCHHEAARKRGWPAEPEGATVAIRRRVPIYAGAVAPGPPHVSRAANRRRTPGLPAPPARASTVTL